MYIEVIVETLSIVVNDVALCFCVPMQTNEQ